jgi:hypothetical protein
MYAAMPSIPSIISMIDSMTVQQCLHIQDMLKEGRRLSGFQRLIHAARWGKKRNDPAM